MPGPEWNEGEVPLRLQGALIRLPLFEAAPGTILFRFPTIGRFLLRRGETTIIDISRTADPGAVHGFLARPLAAASQLLDARFSLRASAVEVEGEAIVLTGPLGAANSALAAVMGTMGFPLLADEVVTFDAVTGAALAGDGRIVLHPRVAGSCGLDSAESQDVRRGLPARSYVVESGKSPLPVRRLFWINPVLVPGPIELSDVEGATKLSLLTSACWHGELISPLGLAAEFFGWSTQLVSDTPFSVTTWDDKGPKATVSRLVEYQR